MFKWALINWRILALGFAILSLLGALFYYGHTKYRQGWDECIQAQEKAEKQATETKNDIKTKNTRAPLSDIDKRLIADWLYGE